MNFLRNDLMGISSGGFKGYPAFLFVNQVVHLQSESVIDGVFAKKVYAAPTRYLLEMMFGFH